MKKILLILALATISFAQPLSLGKPNEEKVHSSWLNLGFGIGVLTPASSPSYKEQGRAFVNPSLLLGIQFAKLTAATFEFDFTAPKGGVGGWFGIEQQLMTTDITPFVEAQVGARNPGRDKRDYSFGDAFGAAASLNGGVIFFRESQFRLRLKGGYEWIFNKDTDMSWNAEIGILFAVGRAGVETIDL